MGTFATESKAQQTKAEKSSEPRRTEKDQSRDVHSLIHLNRMIGNQAVQRLLRNPSADIDANTAGGFSTGFSRNISPMRVYPGPSITSQPLIQRDDITQMSITPEYARGLSNDDLGEQIRILTGQTQGAEFLGSVAREGEAEVSQSNLSILQEEQRRREMERTGRNRAVTQMSITPQHAQALSDEDLREQIQILSEQAQGAEFLGSEEQEGEAEVVQSNLTILQQERRRRNRAVTQTSITPQHARALSDEDLGEQIEILSEQTQGAEFLGAEAHEGEAEVAQSNLSILQEEQGARIAERRRGRIRQANWGGYRRPDDVTAAGVSVDDRIMYLMESLVVRYGYPVDGAAGLVGNFSGETGGTFIPNILQGGRLAQRGEDVPPGGGAGLAQWTGPRRTEFLGTERGAEILFDMDAQIEYVVNELRGRYHGVNNVLTRPQNIEQATSEVLIHYETPAVVANAASDPAAMESSRQQRIRAAIRARDLYLRGQSGP